VNWRGPDGYDCKQSFDGVLDEFTEEVGHQHLLVSKCGNSALETREDFEKW
jgi:hypothetical protein